MKKLEDYSKEALIKLIESSFLRLDRNIFRDLDRIEKNLKIYKLQDECTDLLNQMFKATGKKQYAKWFELNKKHTEKFNELQRLREKFLDQI